jgi:uncharacterized NAD-dependent epimerase/dehydratase family protein
MPDALVLCHEHGREAIHGYEGFAIPPVGTCVDLYEDLAAPVHDTEVVAGMLNTADVDGDAAAREAVDAYADAVGAPATDPIRFDAAEVLEVLR